MAQNSTIQWQTGTPKHPGQYLVTTKHHWVETDIWRNYADCYKNHWYEHNDEDVIAWCFIENIEPFKNMTHEHMTIECYDCHEVINFTENDIIENWYVKCPCCGEEISVLP